MIYNIIDFGAKITDILQTNAIQKAIDTAFLAGGGEVVIPTGIYRTGCIRLRSNVTLHLLEGAILEGSDDPEDYNGYINDRIEPINETDDGKTSRSVYPFSRWNNAIIRAIDAENIAIIGEKYSYIDGVNCYDENGEEKYRGPHGINIQRCKNITLKGYTLRNCGNWAHAIFISQNITCCGVTVYGGHDGFDIRTCDHVLIENCNFITGDDGIAGFDNIDVTIRNCTLDSSCSALRFGGTDIVIDNCRTVAPASFAHRYVMSPERKARRHMTNENDRHNMLTGFLYYCDFRAVIRKAPGNIVISNCEFDSPDNLFELSFDGNHVWCCNRSLSSIKFVNCTVKNVCKPIHIHGDENEKLTFELENVTISAKEGFEDINFIEALNFDKISLKNTKIQGFTNPTILCKNDGEIICEDSTAVEIIKE